MADKEHHDEIRKNAAKKTTGGKAGNSSDRGAGDKHDNQARPRRDQRDDRYDD